MVTLPPGLVRRARLLATAAVTAGAAALLSWAPPAAGQEGPPATSVRGRLSTVVEGERRGVSGVEVTVSRDGEDIGSDTTDGSGDWEVELPGGGAYQVTLVADTLPEDVSLRDPEQASVEVVVRDGQRAGRAFPLGERPVGRNTTPARIANLTVEGVKLGSVIAISAIGLSLVYGLTGLVNFAHGELVTFGALVAWYLNAAGGGPGLQLVLAGGLAVLVGGLFGLSLERALWRPLRDRQTGNIALIVISIGLSLLLRNVYLMLFGGGARPYVDYTVQRAVSVGPISLPPKDYAIVAISLGVLVTVGLLVQRTQTGTAMRAVADSRDLAEASGIDVRRVILVTWIVGTALAALGGVLQGLTERVSADLGFTLLLSVFAAVILGGLGTAHGAMVGGLAIGVITQVSTLWVSVELKSVVALAVLIAMLLVRPQGLLGQPERVG
ncbi:MAG: branched-chain amino acid ABC transporter permease [Acidimicrobiales bacterium]